MASDKKSNEGKKKRNWAIIVYPESAPENWREILRETGLPCAIGPLHDKDVQPDGSGEYKKPHWHLILSYPGPTTFNIVSQVAEQLNAPIPKPLESVRGAYRYLTHADDPSKAQYNSGDIQHLNGFDPGDFLDLTKSEITKIKRNLIRVIRVNDIDEYSDFIDFFDSVEAEELDERYYEVASSHTIFFNSYLTSRRNKKEKIRQREREDAQDILQDTMAAIGYACKKNQEQMEELERIK